MITVTFIAGLPGAGKTTMRALTASRFKNARVLSTDDFIEAKAEFHGVSYNTIFKDTIKEAEKVMNAQAQKSMEGGNDIIVDRTLLTPKSRASMISKLKNIAHPLGIELQFEIFFLDTDTSVIRRRNEERKANGRSVPEHVLDSMIETKVLPTAAEEFRDIYILKMGDAGTVEHMEHIMGSVLAV